jgi:hypothetical protein
MPILEVNFKLNVSTAEYQEICNAIAQPIAEVPGLIWKVWLLNEEEKEAGGVYLFMDGASLDTFLAGPIAAQIQGHPALSELSVKTFEVMGEVTNTTRGPIPMMVAA